MITSSFCRYETLSDPAIIEMHLIGSFRLAIFLVVIAQVAGADDCVDFNRQIRPLLTSRCVACHGPDENERMADLRLDISSGASQDLGGYAAIIPGQADASELIRRITTEENDELMPPPDKGERFSADEVDLMRRWIDEGAKYETHWAYVKPTKGSLPVVQDADWPANEVDQFLLARLESAGLQPSPPADRRTLARRISLDLTGLPPTPQQVDAFVADRYPLAYERFVDATMNAVAFGQHWARIWLDLARYADSSGYPSDQPREIWGYRDWVINALNRNLPFDQFTIEQLAGDLLESPTQEQLIATAFHRNTMTQNEGGTSDEEFRVAAVVDRANTTMAVWLGTTMACAQCHTHKFDPITQQEYFQFFAILNQSADADRKDEAPLLELYSPEQHKQRSGVQAELDKFAVVPDEPADSANDEQHIAALQKKLAAIKPVSVPIMRELPSKERRTTKIQRRGNWQDLGDEVQPGVPAAIGGSASVNDDESRAMDRLALSNWLVGNENPLAARVVVNRLWEAVFGVGIVRTSEDFGTQGEPPFHPELLDWLAVDLVEHDWDTKRLLRQIVTSQAYRQVSTSTSELNELDPDNRLVARGPRSRPTGELLRDQALFVSGLLCDDVGGPPVRPMSPNLGLKTAFGGSNDWTTSEGKDRYRRSIYTEVRRNSPYASFTTFDAPNRETCTIRRDRTNTPLQAFVTLNDPVFVEANQAMARRLCAELPAATAQPRIEYAFQLCVSRDPYDNELKTLAKLYDETAAMLAGDPQSAIELATDPLGPLPPDASAVELAAWTVVANVIMNLDEYLMRQ